MPKDRESRSEIVRMFRQSIAPYSKKLVALHPHLYGNLYRRASEIKALDKILEDLIIAEEEATSQCYGLFPSILTAIKDTLHGQPPISWWNLFTASLGYALGGVTDRAKNAEELNYLKNISEILTRIIRKYKSPNNKLLLDIRLTTLEVDARIVELEKIPEGVQEVNQTAEYLISEFQLVIQEFKKVLQLPKNEWSQNSKTFLIYIEKVNRLMEILRNVELTDYEIYKNFLQTSLIGDLQKIMGDFLKDFKLQNANLDFWQEPQLGTFFDLFNYFPNLLVQMPPREVYTFLNKAESYFLADPDLDKVRSEIFYSSNLKDYILHYFEELKNQFYYYQAVAKGTRADISVKKDPTKYYLEHFINENDLHHLCTLIHSKHGDIFAKKIDQDQIQKEILNRMILLAHIAQPKHLDDILKSFTDEQKEDRYFLLQEVILEQFIRWRKQGIY